MKSDEMSNIDNLVKETLLTLGVPVERMWYNGESATFIIFAHTSEHEAEFADDECTAIEHNYRADICSKGDFKELLRRAKNALKAAGFYGITENGEMFDNEIAYYCVSLNFDYMEEL